MKIKILASFLVVLISLFIANALLKDVYYVIDKNFKLNITNINSMQAFNENYIISGGIEINHFNVANNYEKDKYYGIGIIDKSGKLIQGFKFQEGIVNVNFLDKIKNDSFIGIKEAVGNHSISLININPKTYTVKESKILDKDQNEIIFKSIEEMKYNQVDEKIFISGNLKTKNSKEYPIVVKLLLSGKIDTTFNFDTNNFDSVESIRKIAIQNDGKIILTGIFSYKNGNLTTRNLCRLNKDGKIDFSFLANSKGFNGYYTCYDDVVINKVNGITICGTSNIFNSDSIYAGLIKLDSLGSLDKKFNYFYQGFTHPLGLEGEIVKCLQIADSLYIVGGIIDKFNGKYEIFNHLAIVDESGELKNQYKFILPKQEHEFIFNIFVVDKNIIFISREGELIKLKKLSELEFFIYKNIKIIFYLIFGISIILIVLLKIIKRGKAKSKK